MTDQSAAFLAGQQHGRQLAVKHAAPPQKKTAAPAKTKAAAPTDLLARASQLAGAQTQAQVDAIRAQQDVYNKQAQDRAGQVTLASQAAAKYLTGLGDQTSGSYNNAAQILAGLAQGYSGDLKQTATDAAAQVQQQLAQLGAPAAGLKTSTGETPAPANLANVLYGLGGQIPANLLATSGQALAGAQRGIPASVLGYGQQEAAGTLAAGQKQADTLTPQILDAQGKLPALTQQTLSNLQDELKRQFDQKLSLAKYNTGIDQFNARQGLSEAKYATQTKLSVQRINLESQRIANQAYQSDRTYAVSLANLGISQKKLQIQALADEAKLKNGGFTPAQVAKYQGKGASVADDAFNGVPKFDKNGNAVTKNGKPVWDLPPLDYKQALREARKEGVPVSIATAELNKVYTTPGQRGRPLKDTGAASFDFSALTQLTGGEWNGPLGKVTVAPGANRAGVALSPVVQSFVARVANLVGKPLTIGTGSNHNEKTVDGNESDHWTGNAADIPASGATLTNLGQKALIAAGADPGWARRQTGGLFNLDTPNGRVQVIFNTNEGGNHFNHLHVGIR